MLIDDLLKKKQRKRLDEEQRKSDERKAAYKKVDAAIQDLNGLCINKIRLYRNGDVFYLCDGLTVATSHYNGKTHKKMTFNNPFSSFDYSKATPIFQDKKNGNLYYCNTETVDLSVLSISLKRKDFMLYFRKN